MTCQATSEAKRLRGGIATRRTWDAIESCRPSLSAASIGEQHMHTASSLISQPARIDDSCVMELDFVADSHQNHLHIHEDRCARSEQGHNSISYDVSRVNRDCSVKKSDSKNKGVMHQHDPQKHFDFSQQTSRTQVEQEHMCTWWR